MHCYSGSHLYTVIVTFQSVKLNLKTLIAGLAALLCFVCKISGV